MILSSSPLPILPKRHLQVVNVLSRKGGAGKTTISLIIARYLAERADKPLVVVLDLDFSGTSIEDAIVELGGRAADGDRERDGTALEQYLLDAPHAPGWEAQAAETLRAFEPQSSTTFYFAPSAGRLARDEEQIMSGAQARELIRQRLHRLARWIVEQNPLRRHFVFVLDNSPGIRGLGQELLEKMFEPGESKISPPPTFAWADIFVTTPDRQDLLASFHSWLDAYDQRKNKFENDDIEGEEAARQAAERALFLVNKLDPEDGPLDDLLQSMLPKGLAHDAFGEIEIEAMLRQKRVPMAHCEFAKYLARMFRGLKQAEIPPIQTYIPGLRAFLETIDPLPAEPKPPSSRDAIPPSKKRSDYFLRNGRTTYLRPVPNGIAISTAPLMRGLHAPLCSALERRGLYRTLALHSPDVEVYELPRRENAAALLEELRAKDGVRFANRLYEYDPANPENLLVLTDRLVLQFDEALSPERVEETALRNGLLLLEPVEQIKNAHLAIVRRGAKENALEIANRLLEEGIAWQAEPDWVRCFATKSTSKPLLEKDQWHLRNDGSAGKRGADARVMAAWALGAKGKGVTIAIIDAGIDIDHPQLAVLGKLGQGFNVKDGSADPRPRQESAFVEDHGTHVAGVAVAARTESNAAAGAAPEARLIPIRSTEVFAGTVAEWNVYRAFAHAHKHNADIVSCSWGSVEGRSVVDDMPFYVKKQVELLTQTGRSGKGTLIFFAAGNGNESVSTNGWATHPDVIAVAASNDHDQKSEYSDFGPEIWIAAPSHPRGIVTLAPSGDHVDDFGGTSAACPLAAGVAALVLSANPELSRDEVKTILAETADRIDPNGSFLDRYGKKYDTAYVDGRSLAYGHGRINAEEAVKRAFSPRGKSSDTELP